MRWVAASVSGLHQWRPHAVPQALRRVRFCVEQFAHHFHATMATGGQQRGPTIGLDCCGVGSVCEQCLDCDGESTEACCHESSVATLGIDLIHVRLGREEALHMVVSAVLDGREQGEETVGSSLESEPHKRGVRLVAPVAPLGGRRPGSHRLHCVLAVP